MPAERTYSYAILWLLLHLGASRADMETIFYKCCQEGNLWAASSSSCEGMAADALSLAIPNDHRTSCQITMEICCRASVKERQCNAGKAAARNHLLCDTPQTQDYTGDMYKDCCDGCRLGLSAAKMGSSCRFETFSLALPWDDAFYQCCSGKDDMTDDNAGENSVPVPKVQENENSLCPKGFKLQEDGRCMSPNTPQETQNAHLCEKYNPCMHRCRNHGTTHVCECFEGYQLDQDQKSCSDVDECIVGTHNCDTKIHECINKPGGFMCREKSADGAPTFVPSSLDDPQCNAGFKYNSAMKDCIDVDECSEGLADCEFDTQTCLNSYGAFQCLSKEEKECPAGYKWHNDQCIDIDECHEGLDGCAENEYCVNAVGSFSCIPKAQTCPAGHRINSVSGYCEDIDECKEYSHSCVGHLVCINTKGSYLCERRQPDTKDNHHTNSKEIPVRTDSHKNNQGKDDFHRRCAPGLKHDIVTDTCRDINECDDSLRCAENEDCNNYYGGYNCSCKDGYQREDGACKDVNECQYGGHNCQIGFRCDNIPGSFTCVRISGCGTGYTVNGVTGQCEDDDECAMGFHNCGPGFVCRNTEGSFRCVRKTCPGGARLLADGSCQALDCPVGMRADSFGKCADINECAYNRSICGRYRKCINTIGSYQCVSSLGCPPGYEPNQYDSHCIDIDECTRGTHDCKSNQNCENQPGSYQCECPVGYRMDQFKNCTDIDECTWLRGRVCSVYSDCKNTPGSYTCDCKDGFRRGDDDHSCIDIDECETKLHTCEHSCINVWGSYQCSCNQGYRKAPDERTCIDIDECEQWKNRGNLCIGTCENTPGSYTCSCPEGYKLSADKRTCHDIDECERGDVCQGENEVCLNTRGGYRCNTIHCPDGYVRDLDHKTRCKRLSRECVKDDRACIEKPVSLSYNYFTLVNNMKIPASGQLDFFTMRGPRFSFSTVHFDLELSEARASSRVKGVEVATRDHFYFRRTGFNEAMVALVRPLQGPQDIQLQLKMKIFQHGLYAGNAVAKIFIYVTENDF